MTYGTLNMSHKFADIVHIFTIFEAHTNSGGILHHHQWMHFPRKAHSHKSCVSIENLIIV